LATTSVVSLQTLNPWSKSIEKASETRAAYVCLDSHLVCTNGFATGKDA